MAGGGGLATALPPLGSDSLKLNCRKNSLVSLRCEEKCGKTVKMKKQLTCSSGTRIAAQTCPPHVKGPSRILLIYVSTPCFDNCDDTLNAIVSYGSAAKRRYCHFLSGGST